MRKTMLLFGGSGLLGTRIIQLLSLRYTIIRPTRADVNLVVKKQVEDIVDRIKSDIIVYVAGETNVDRVEVERDYAMRVNKEAVFWIAKRAKLSNIPIIYFSTDAVFRGDQEDRPYKETDKVNPINYYGFTKAKGEEVVLNNSNKNLVIRLITLYTSYYERKLDFARAILIKLQRNLPCYGMIDQYCNPTFSDDAVYGLHMSVEKKISGIIHFGAKDYLTNYSFAKRLATKFGYSESNILPTTVVKFYDEKYARRPRYAWLDTTMAQTILGEDILHTNTQNIDSFFKMITSVLIQPL